VYTPQTQPLSSSSSDQKITEQTTNKEPTTTTTKSKGNKQINDREGSSGFPVFSVVL